MSYRNAMELLVEQEVERQVKTLPPKIASYVNRLELVAYALNQLPPLYATSERGFEHQLQRGRRHSDQIAQAVQRAIAAIRRDPIRTYVPLQPSQSALMQDVLCQLKRLLKNEKISWEGLPGAVKEAIEADRADSPDAAAVKNIPPLPLRSSVQVRRSSSPFADLTSPTKASVPSPAQPAWRARGLPSPNSSSSHNSHSTPAAETRDEWDSSFFR